MTEIFELWCIVYRPAHGKWTHPDPMTFRSLRKDAWRAWEDQFIDYADMWKERMRRDRRKGLYRAVRMLVQEMPR
jgi:hypothetical protein